MMRKLSSALICLLLVLSMVFSMVPLTFAVPSETEIITPASGYQAASEVEYVISDAGIIANWGARGEDCTFLTTYAESYYTDGITYEELSAFSGGTTAANAHESDLYDKLQAMMVSKHTTATKYGGTSKVDCKNFYHYTDCMLGDTSQVSTLYRGTLVVGPWDGGKSYNQEHIWPQSKCIGTSSEDVGDIMQLRAAVPSENSSRQNTAYGLSEDFYDPGVSVRGDCARTLLYVYTRWGNTEYLWGADGVIESLDIMLQWIAEDPVDTWEMGHNDAVESITGVRNVFVDYPEYAFLLFGREIPQDMLTPSGNEEQQTGTAATLVTDVKDLQAGDQIVLVAADYNYALSTEQKTSNRGQASVVKSQDGNQLSFGADTQVITLCEGTVANSFGFAAGEGGYLNASSSSANQLKTGTELSDNGSWIITIDGTTGVATVIAQGTYTRNQLKYNATSGLFACYAEGSTQKDVKIYRLGDSQEEENDLVASLVTGASQLKAGDQIIIVAADYDYALSTEQKTSNRGQAAVIKSEDGNTVSFEAATQVITLCQGTVADSFGFMVGDAGYLNASSSTANQLKTGTELSDNGSWNITIDGTTGVATVIAQGTYTRNQLKYNATSGLFSCYAEGSTQKDVKIYKIGASASEEEEPTASGFVTDASLLKVGDQIMIAALDYDFAMSTEQKTNNRGQSAFTRNGDGSVAYGTDVQIVTLQQGLAEGTFAFCVGDGSYLYAPSSSANNLKTTTTLNENGSWKVTIDENGKATIQAQGTSTRSIMRYNASSGLFACYETEGSVADVCIYLVGNGGAQEVIAPTLTLDHPSLSFEGEIMYNLYFTADDLTSVEEMGLISFNEKLESGTIDNAENVYPGYIEAGGMYMSQTAGVPARYLGDAVYFKAYAKLSDGSYVYSGMAGYNAAVYAKSILKNSTNDYMKRLVVAMINYGAEAQAYFCGKEGVEYTPMNNFLTADQQALINAYDASMVADLISVDSSKIGMFTYNTGDFTKRSNSVSFDGAFAINYYFTAKGTPDNGMKFYYWNTADYLAADVLTPENATGTMDMVAGSGNQYWSQVSGIAAKEVDQTYFVAGVYELDGVTYTTGILAYSLGKYCAKLAAGTTEQQALSAATAVYGYYAKEYFANI